MRPVKGVSLRWFPRVSRLRESLGFFNGTAESLTLSSKAL